MKSIFLACAFLLNISYVTKAAFKSDSVVRPQLRTSQIVISSLNTENCYVKVTYGQPLKRGRTVFGGIVPFDKIWRTGANEATEITFTKNVVFGKQNVNAGTYTMFTVPNKNKWRIILNSELGQWGETKYDSTKNITSFEIDVNNNNAIIYEGFTISVTEQDKLMFVDLLWDKTSIKIPVSLQLVAEESSKKKKRRNK